MSSHLGLIEAVMLEIVVMTVGVRELYLLRKDERKTAAEKRDDAASKLSSDDPQDGSSLHPHDPLKK
jgi:hypothetical protein